MTRFPILYAPNRDAGAAAGMVSAYVIDLSPFPTWAIDSAIQRIISGGEAFMPSSPALRLKCAEFVGPLHAEIAELRALEEAEIFVDPTPEERSRVALAMGELAKSFPRQDRRTRTEQSANSLESLERYRDLPTKLSSAALRTVGVAIEDMPCV